ncbi:hypothetical protein QQZ08_007235 [Neonectria magnoliae]|uniref:Inheritance of peroxisomes protein 1 n=1 Tax=Neonectria magnoliae TaxID=2732573 RepID=A0ABR1HZS9_9HYPO
MDDSTSTPPRPRRVSTATASQVEATRASSPSPSSSAAALTEGIVETLYSHPNAKIISFSASSRAFSRSSGLPADDAPNSLSWSSQIERTIAVGPFRIYRAPGSVAFLNCGSALQPILPKSQCWCIDEINSKFVLQIRRPQYWRIELPVAELEDQERAIALREVLDRILQFEKTICPFKRTFTVELPECPDTPLVKKPWTPVLRSPPVTPADATSPISPTLARRASMISQVTTPTPAPLTKDLHPDVPESPLDIRSESPRPSRHVPESPPTSRPENSSSKSFVPLRVGELESAIETENAERLEAFDGSGNLFDRTWDTEGPQPKEPKERRQRSDEYDFEWNPEEYDTESRRLRLPPLLVPSMSHDGLHITHSSKHTSTTPKCLSSQGHHELSMVAESPTPLDNPTDAYELHEGTGSHGDRMKTRLRRTAFALTRSSTMPSHSKSALTASTSSSNAESHLRKGREGSSSANTSGFEEQRLRRRGSEDSFHTVQSRHPDPQSSSPSTPTPQLEGTGKSGEGDPAEANDITSHGEDISETISGWETGSDGGSAASHESDATAPDDLPIKMVGAFPVSTTPDAVEEPPPVTRPRRSTASHRATTSSISVRGGPLSPLPSAANLFTPAQLLEQHPYQSKLAAVKRIPMAIITKTLEMILGPPTYLIKLMLQVAAKILAGEWRGLVYGYNEEGEEIPVQWDYSDGELSDWSDDEYMGSHQGGHRHRRHRSWAKNGGGAAEDSPESPLSSKSSRSWGVD